MPPTPVDQLDPITRALMGVDAAPPMPRRGRPPKDSALSHKTGPPRPLNVEAFSIPEFCRAHSISRTHYYELKKNGLAPDEAELLGRIIITKEAAARWRKLRTTRRVPTAVPTS